MENNSKLSELYKRSNTTNKFAKKNKDNHILSEVYFLVIYTFIQFLKNKTVVSAPYLFLRNVVTPQKTARFSTLWIAQLGLREERIDYGVRSDY